MPEKENGDSDAIEPDQNALARPPRRPPGNQDPPGQPAWDNPGGGDSETARLERDIRTGEGWLIGLQALTLFVGIIVAVIYYGQLGQMRIATEANTKALKLAQDSLELNQGNFDRMMQRTVDQTAAQIRSSDASKSAADTASKQLTILKQQLEATQDAVIDMGYVEKRPELSGIDEPFGPDDPKLSIWIKNIGHANAREVKVEMGISVIELSDDSRVLLHNREEFTLPPLPPVTVADDGYQKDFKKVIPVSYLAKINKTEATLRIEGVVRYNNGIDTIQVQEPFCYSFIRAIIFHRDRRRGVAFSTSGFAQCFDFDSNISAIRRRESEVANEK